MNGPSRVAIVHEWLTTMRGGERCVEALCEIFPEATLFTLLHNRGSVSETIERMPIRTSFVQRLPGAARLYRRYLPVFPAAVRRFRLDGFDCVITSNHCVAKGVAVPAGALHVCYCHTPMRYVWDQYEEYFGRGKADPLTRAAMALVRRPLQRWDVKTARNPHYFVANSENVRERIRRLYGREADVIYPPVETARFSVSSRDDGFFLIVSALVAYKKVDLAVRAASGAGERLVIVGDGPELGRLRAQAGPTVEFVGWRPDEEIRHYYEACTGVLFPGEEDFGIVPLEAMACGKPVIAYARGGALETVIARDDLRTGVLFHEPSAEALLEAMRRCRETSFDQTAMRRFALRFDREAYKKEMRRYVVQRWGEFRG